MKTTLLTLALLAGLTTTSLARLGESVDICAQRYGEPTASQLDEKQNGVAVYNKNDLTIKVHFTMGKVDLIRYSPGIVQEINLDIANELLKRNGRKKEWTQLTETEEIINDIRDDRAQHPRVQIVDPILWQSKDEILEASYSDSKKTLEIKSADMDQKILEDL